MSEGSDREVRPFGSQGPGDRILHPCVAHTPQQMRLGVCVHPWRMVSPARASSAPARVLWVCTLSRRHWGRYHANLTRQPGTAEGWTHPGLRRVRRPTRHACVSLSRCSELSIGVLTPRNRQDRRTASRALVVQTAGNGPLGFQAQSNPSRLARRCGGTHGGPRTKSVRRSGNVRWRPLRGGLCVQDPSAAEFAGIISGIGPVDAPGALDGMEKSNRLQITLARKAPWLLTLLFRAMARSMRHEPTSSLRSSWRPCPNRTGRRWPNRCPGTTLRMLDAAFQQGARGATWDTSLCARPWGFRLQDIAMPVHLCMARRTTLCRSDGSLRGRVHSGLPRRVLPGRCHLSTMRHYDEVLTAVAYQGGE